MRTQIDLSVRATAALSAPYDGTTAAVMEFARVLTSGDGANQANKAAKTTVTVATESNEDVDLSALEDAEGNAIDPDKIVVLWIEVAGAEARMKAGASNGWTSYFSGTTDHVVLKPGAGKILYNPTADAWAVASANKVINFANPDDTNAATVTILAIAREDEE